MEESSPRRVAPRPGVESARARARIATIDNSRNWRERFRECFFLPAAEGGGGQKLARHDFPARAENAARLFRYGRVSRDARRCVATRYNISRVTDYRFLRFYTRRVYFHLLCSRYRVRRSTRSITRTISFYIIIFNIGNLICTCVYFLPLKSTIKKYYAS